MVIRMRECPAQWQRGLWIALLALVLPVAAEELRFSAAEPQSQDFILSPGARRVELRGKPAVRLQEGATLRTAGNIRPPASGFSLLLRLRINELGDPTAGGRVHNHAVLSHPSMVIIVTWAEVLVWHFPFHQQGKVAEANLRYKAGQELVLGWVLSPDRMVVYVGGLPISDQALPVPLAEKDFADGPLVVGGPYGDERPLSLDVSELVYAEEPWSEAEMAARTAGTTARLAPESLAECPVAGEPTLEAGRNLRVWLDADNGSLEGLARADVPGAPAARSLDIYRVLDGPCSSEAEDRVYFTTPMGDGLRLSCRNETLGLDIAKEYRLDLAAGELTKTLTLRADKPMILAVEARTALPSTFRDGAFYTQWLYHTHGERLFIPASEVTRTRAAAPNASMQSQLVMLTRPDLVCTYAEVPLSVDGEPAYPAIPDAAFGRKTLFTPDGWQALRGVVEVEPGRPGTIVTSYRWCRLGHLGYLRDYVQRVYRPAFGPQPGSPLPREYLACDGTGVFLCNLARPEGDKLVYNGAGGVWAPAQLSGMIAALDPLAYGTMVVFEGFSHGDLLSDNVYQWWPEDRGGPTHGKTNIFRTTLDEYMRIMRLTAQDTPRLRLGRYERTGVMSWVAETPARRPDILAPPETDAPPNPAVYPMPYFWDDKPTYELPINPVVYFDLLGDYFARLIRLGLPIAYLDWAVPGPYVRREAGGPHLVSWAAQIAAVRDMARKVHGAGGAYFVNLPSGPWSDFGYMEYTPWQADNARDWRILADRLQLAKAQEMLPNTTVPLYFQGRDYPVRCLAYNLVPNPFSPAWFDGSGAGQVVTEELLRLRWALRDAEMTGALVRPVPWEPGAPPVEACVMRLAPPGEGEVTLYIPLIYHGAEPEEVALSADLRAELGDERPAVWRCEFLRAPWHGLPEKPFTTERVELGFTRLENALDEAGVLHIRETLQPERLRMLLIGDWQARGPFAPHP